MKSEVKSRGAEKLPFPKLMSSSTSGVIILATSEVKDKLVGIVVGNASKHLYIGEHRKDWIKSMFHDFHGTVELSND